jgi:hypothetical protein
MKIYNKEIRLGTRTFCTLFGKGIVATLYNNNYDFETRAILVNYENTNVVYNLNGKIVDIDFNKAGTKRQEISLFCLAKDIKPTLYFRDPKIYGYDLAKYPLPTLSLFNLSAEEREQLKRKRWKWLAMHGGGTVSMFRYMPKLYNHYYNGAITSSQWIKNHPHEEVLRIKKYCDEKECADYFEKIDINKRLIKQCEYMLIHRSDWEQDSEHIS